MRGDWGRDRREGRSWGKRKLGGSLGHAQVDVAPICIVGCPRRPTWLNLLVCQDFLHAFVKIKHGGIRLGSGGHPVDVGEGKGGQGSL